MRHISPTIELKHGLRPEENTKAEGVYLVEAIGVLREESGLHSLDVVNLLTTTDPLVQIERLKNHIVVITTTGFYELISGALVPKLTIASTDRWGVADYGEFILFVDSTRAVSRDPFSGVYTQRYDIPKGFDAVNYNGQCLVIGVKSV